MSLNTHDFLKLALDVKESHDTSWQKGPFTLWIDTGGIYKWQAYEEFDEFQDAKNHAEEVLDKEDYRVEIRNSVGDILFEGEPK